jgi:hypothetical protein
MKGMMVGERELIMALSNSWSYRIQSLWEGFGNVWLSVVIVFGEQGIEPSIYPMRSYPMNSISNWSFQEM